MNPEIKESILWQKNGDAILCLTCEKKCRILPQKTGHCKTRKNIDGKLWTLVYGDISSISANPIEKKPFFHFYPGTKALTVGTWSCNFTCPWCQNYEISKYPENIGMGNFITPSRFIELLEIYKCQGTSISFNEPILLFEYSIDVFKLAKEKGYYNTFVTNGYMTSDGLRILVDSGLDAMNIDIKGDKDAVKKYCGADVEKIWRNAVNAKKWGVWIELTTLVISGINDDDTKLKNIASRIKNELGDETPWHISRYYPAWKFSTAPTPLKKLEIAREIGKSEGLKYVYTGNVPGHAFENTYCPKCNKLLITRAGFNIIENKLINSKNNCPQCGYKIKIIS